MKWLLYLIELADVILAPHNLAAFLFEYAVMVPGQLTASWTPERKLSASISLWRCHISRVIRLARGTWKVIVSCCLLNYFIPDFSNSFIMHWRQLACMEMNRFSFSFWDVSKSNFKWIFLEYTFDCLMMLHYLHCCSERLYQSPLVHLLPLTFITCMWKHMSKHKGVEIACTCL